MKLGEYLLQHVEFNKKQFEAIGKRSYRLGTGHRQLFRPERYPNTVVMTDNASHCLAGFCVMPKGIFVFHDPPFRVARIDLPLAKDATGNGIIGGDVEHWESVQDIYNSRRGIQFEYIEKPLGQRMNIDLSFAFQIDIKKKLIDYGYYLNPKGLSGDGWIWE